MTRTASFWVGSLVVLASTGAAQLLASGNAQLPTCGSNCAQLIEAARVCGGATTADQAVWTCFCSSASLATLYNSPAGICDASCTSASDNRKVMAWFVSNCGTDLGLSEHAPNGGTTTIVITTTSAPPTAGGTASVSKASGASLPSTTAQAGVVASEDTPNEDDNWWNTHYKWIIMLIALFVGLSGVALLATCLKRRHDRRADQIRNGFNSGITTRSTGKSVADPDRGPALPPAPPVFPNTTDIEPSPGRDSPARSRNAFMPYGYGYSYSESRIAPPPPESMADARQSPGPRAQIPLDDMGRVAMTESALKREGKRVLVRERSEEHDKS